MSVHKIQNPIAIRPRQTSEQQDAKLKEAAQLYEKQFINEMVKAMRQTVQHSEWSKPSMAENIYRSQLDDQYVDSWSARGGVGLADMIYQQLQERFGRGSEVEKPNGPIPLENRKVEPLPVETQDVGFRFAPEADKQVPLTSPWKGRVERLERLAGNESATWIRHDNGLMSKLVFKGEWRGPRPGSTVESGETIAQLARGEGAVWSVSRG